MSTNDVASASNFSTIITNHLEFDWNLDFEAQQLEGTTVLHLQPLASTSKVVLDVNLLNIESVDQILPVEATGLTYKITPFTGFGSAMEIQLPQEVEAADSNTVVLKITYSAGKSDAFCWLTPEQTADKEKPYLFTQGQACLNRGMFPCQDSPSVRITYDARVTVPEGITVVMSAIPQTAAAAAPAAPAAAGTAPAAPAPAAPAEAAPAEAAAAEAEAEAANGSSNSSSGSSTLFRFHMPHSIPDYLVAMAAGDLVSAPIGPRSRVWAERSVLPAAAAEFEGLVEQYLAAGEKVFGEYRWSIYDVVVMPPCFPWGGMENPLLTFVTPCLLCGDRSLGDVIAHEIAHSWFGNLITNAEWGQFWLNEGFTMYAQRRITTEVHGAAFTALEATTGRALLEQTVATAPDGLTKLNVLIQPGIDPDDTYNEVPYEKGYVFVKYLEHLVGDLPRFDAFLRAYIERNAFASVTAQSMLQQFCDTFPELRADRSEGALPGCDFDTWLHTPGLPPWWPDHSDAQALTAPAEELAAWWASPAADGGADAAPTAAAAVVAWPIYQQLHFLDTMLRAALNMPAEAQAGAEAEAEAKAEAGDDAASPAYSGAALGAMDATYGYSQSTNAEIRLRWGQIVVALEYTPAFPSVANFLSIQGKQKYVRPLYTALAAGSSEAQALAVATFAATRSALHSTQSAFIDQLLLPLQQEGEKAEQQQEQH